MTKALIAALSLALGVGSAVAQTISFETELEQFGAALRSEPVDPSQVSSPNARPNGPEMSSGSQAVMRALDKVSGQVVDLTIELGQEQSFHRLRVRLDACRFPTENPASDSFAFVEIREDPSDEMVFRGWMVASSPALNALDHARYDIWALRCS